MFAFGSLIVVSVCVSLEAACLALALPTIASELKGSSIEAFWTGSSFLLASAVSQPIFASFSILFGRKLVRNSPSIILYLSFFLGHLHWPVHLVPRDDRILPVRC